MSETKKELKEYTSAEIQKHTSEDDCWMIIGNEMNGTLLPQGFVPLFGFAVIRIQKST